MSTEKAEAIVLRVVDFSETSCVVTVFTREFGKISGLAKGARRLKGPFESALDLLSRVRLVFLRKSSDALDLLTEAKLERRFRPAAGDLHGLYAAYYVAELLDDLTHEDDPHPDLYDVACDVLDRLAANVHSAGTVVLRWELTALRLLGHLPSLDDCVGCGNAIVSERRTAFGLSSGGVLCEACKSGKRHVVSLSRAALDVLRTFAEPDSGWAETPIERREAGELRGLMNQYLNHFLGHSPRLQSYLIPPVSRS